MLAAYIDDKGSDLLLAKISGEQGHGGGVQLPKDSDGYAAIQKVVTELSKPSKTTTYSFEVVSPIATITSASTDGSPSASVFELSVQSSVAPTGLTTTTDFSLSLTLRPQTSDIAKSASVYTIIVANNHFFKLEPDGSYAPWNGAVETLTPFATNQMLSSTQTLTLLDGTIAEAGTYLYFAAYSVEGETRLHFTPEPAQISVKLST